MNATDNADGRATMSTQEMLELVCSEAVEAFCALITTNSIFTTVES